MPCEPISTGLRPIRGLYRIFLWLGAAVAVPAVAAGGQGEHDPSTASRADEIRAQAEFTGGLIVHLGCGDGRLTAALSKGDCVVQGLETDVQRVVEARQYLADRGLYGRVSVDTFDGRHLPFADNLVNLLVVEEAGDVAPAERMRVLAPGGVAVTLDAQRAPRACVRKAWPEDLDDWGHFLYDASGNPVSSDRRVGPPRRLQWEGAPRWSRSHETDMSLTAAVTAGGRLFHSLDQGPIGIHETPRDHRRLPDQSSLVARDAFNGLLLWKRPLDNWGSAAWDAHRWRWGKADQLWSSPLTLPRRLVATGDRLYMTLGFRAPVSELDAATGKTLREFPETEATEEMVWSEGILVLRVRDQTGSAPQPQSIRALDVASGEMLWQQPVEAVSDLTLAVAEGRVCFHNTRELVALDLHTGELLWKARVELPRRGLATEGTLVMADQVVLFAAGSHAEARSAVDGQQLWTRKTNTSFRGVPDVSVAGGLAWLGTLTTTGLDLATGQPVRQIDPGHLFTGGHHARCHRGKATERYLLWSKRGVEFVDLQSDRHMRHDWVRGTCRYGILPANGLLYAPPDPCFCYPGVKLAGFHALAAESPSERPAPPATERLQRGPAYGKLSLSPGVTDDSGDWPTYRRDAARSGSIASEVPPALQRQWTSSFDGKVSPAVVVGGRVFVAEIDAHRVTCLDAETGARLWSYTAGGAVDSPPTVHRGKVLFGGTDGYVYCLRAADGVLVWRFRAAPAERRIMSYGRLESPWPVHGSVLVEGENVYFAAGRSSFLDGGISLYALDAATGTVRHRAHLEGPWPDLTLPSDRAHDMEGSKNDILVATGGKLYLTQNVFDLELRPIESPRIARWGAREAGLHLVATGGFLDDSGFDRLYWMHARRWPGMYSAIGAPKAGQILVFDDTTTYALHTFNRQFSRSPYFDPGTDGHTLVADDNDNEPMLPAESARRERGNMVRERPPKWSVQIPVRARAMVLAGETLFLAGPPDVIDDDDPYGAFEGRQGGRLWAVSTTDGTRLAEYSLDSPPVFDGLIAADGRLFLTSKDGRLSCWEPASPSPATKR